MVTTVPKQPEFLNVVCIRQKFVRAREKPICSQVKTRQPGENVLIYKSKFQTKCFLP